MVKAHAPVQAKHVYLLCRQARPASRQLQVGVLFPGHHQAGPPGQLRQQLGPDRVKIAYSPVGNEAASLMAFSRPSFYEHRTAQASLRSMARSMLGTRSHTRVTIAIPLGMGPHKVRSPSLRITAGSWLRKNALPATNTSMPASTRAGLFSALTPPSKLASNTWPGKRFVRSARTFNFVKVLSINCWPPKPGFTRHQKHQIHPIPDVIQHMG